jgi:hypothetical protein
MERDDYVIRSTKGHSENFLCLADYRQSQVCLLLFFRRRNLTTVWVLRDVANIVLRQYDVDLIVPLTEFRHGNVKNVEAYLDLRTH